MPTILFGILSLFPITPLNYTKHRQLYLNLKAEKVHYCLRLGPGDFYLDDREVHLSSSFAVGEGGADIARN